MTNLKSISITAFLLLAVFFGNTVSAQSQFTFMGDYDKTFAAPNGYYLDPQNPDPTSNIFRDAFVSGELLADGSIIAGGYFTNINTNRADFYLRKFTASGAVDASFGTNGLTRTNFFQSNNPTNGDSSDFVQVTKVQPDGKIVLAGQCYGIQSSDVNTIPFSFGDEVCVIRYNADGTIDTSFGNSTVQVGGGINGQGQQNTIYSFQVGAGRFSTQTGLIVQPGNPRRGTGGLFYDMAIQPDGKILLVGETTNFYNPGSGNGGIIVRLNTNGTLDATFGDNGIARWNAPQFPTGCFAGRGFNRLLLQSDGRIVAVGYGEVTRPEDCFAGRRFAVTRWTSAGQFETVRYLDNPTNVGVRDTAAGVLLNRDGNKIFVSGKLDGLATMARLNLNDLSVDTTFGVNGIRRYNIFCNPNGTPQTGTLYIKVIQPDGRILGLDTDSGTPMARFNPDGTPDLSFGNAGQPGGASGGCGRVRLDMLYYNGQNLMFTANHILLRPNGRTVFLGATPQGQFNEFRAAVSQQNTVLKNGIHSDFTNDGKSEIAIYRPSDGVWYQTNSASGTFSGVAFGAANDKIAPADYDGDGKTDVAVFRNGIWYILQSANNSFRAIGFGVSGDLPRPGDFDADGLADIALFRPSNGTWYRLNSSNNQFVGAQFGQSGDAPLIADFDADGKSDLTVFRAGVWYYLQSSDNQFRAAQFGLSTDVPTVGDYDADGKSDIAVWRPSNGVWYRQSSSTNSFTFAQFGQNGDRPVPGDYDNDGKNDLAVYRGGTWYVQRSGDNSFYAVAFGLPTDTPVPAAYLP